MKAKPFLKWAGGKGKLTTKILAALPERIAHYHEPFLGGGAVFFALANANRFDNAYISDANTDLITTYIVVRDHVSDLISELSGYRSTEDEYYHRRSSKPLDSIKLAAWFIYVNKCGFNGLHRVNKKGKFNVPWCRRSDVRIFDEANLTECSEALSRVSIFSCDFSDNIGDGRDDVTYLDPPYLPISITANFASYTSPGFSNDDHARLSTKSKQAATRGVTCVVSGADTEATREFYKGFAFETVSVRRSIAANKESRKAITEVIMTPILGDS